MMDAKEIIADILSAIYTGPRSLDECTAEHILARLAVHGQTYEAGLRAGSLSVEIERLRAERDALKKAVIAYRIATTDTTYPKDHGIWTAYDLGVAALSPPAQESAPDQEKQS